MTMTASWIKADAFARLQKSYSDGVAAVSAAWAAGLPDPTLPAVAPVVPVVPVIQKTGQASNATITYGGLSWLVQSGTADGVSIGDDGRLYFHAKAGEHASFDPARKIRAELGGTKTFAKGELIHLSGTFNIDPSTDMGDADWLSVFQIHAEDVRFVDGVPVSASPMFAIDAVPGSGGKMLRVRAETGMGMPLPNTFFPYRILGTFPVTFGVDHAFDITVVDGHGGAGSVKVVIDGKPVCDFTGPTGYEFVDLAPIKSPHPGSYWKIGIYAGKDSGGVAPVTTAAYAVKFTP
jgi:hypothetical protein